MEVYISVPIATCVMKKDYCLIVTSDRLQHSNVAFRVFVMDTLLYLSGDVEKNPGPLCK